MVQECHLGGRFFPLFWPDIFNMAVFHLCTFHLIFARLLPQIQIPLSSVLNKRPKKKKELSLNLGRKEFPRVSQIFPSYLIGSNCAMWPVSEERLEKYPDKKREVTWKAQKKYNLSPGAGPIAALSQASTLSARKRIKQPLLEQLTMTPTPFLNFNPSYRKSSGEKKKKDAQMIPLCFQFCRFIYS